MSIESELERLNTAKSNLVTAIQKKGVIVPDLARLDDYDFYVDAIPTRISGAGCTASMRTNLGTVNGADGQKVKLPLDTVDTTYGSTGLSNGGILIPKNGYYLVSAQVMVSDGATGAYLGLQVDSTNLGVLMDAYTGFSKGYGTISCSPSLFFLEEGDILYLYARIGTTDQITYTGNSRTKITLLQVS